MAVPCRKREYITFRYQHNIIPTAPDDGVSGAQKKEGGSPLFLV